MVAKILLAEMEEAVRNVVRQMLERHGGHEVTVSIDSTAAVALYDRGSFGLVIGDESVLSWLLHLANERQRVLLITGADAERLAAKYHIPALQEPVRLPELLAKVADILDQPATPVPPTS